MFESCRWSKLSKELRKRNAEEPKFSRGFFSLLRRNFGSTPATMIFLASDSNFLTYKVDESVKEPHLLERLKRIQAFGIGAIRGKVIFSSDSLLELLNLFSFFSIPMTKPLSYARLRCFY